MKLGHVHIKVRKLEPAVDFYTGLFELEVTEEVAGRFAFLTGNEMHHTIALQARGAGAPAPDPSGVGLFHIAFEVADKRAFARKYRQLFDMGIRPYPVDHRISWAIYFNDPDGNGLEIYVDTRQEEDTSTRWSGSDRPLSAEQILEFLDT